MCQVFVIHSIHLFSTHEHSDDLMSTKYTLDKNVYIIIFRNYAKCVFNSDRYQMLINQTLKKISNDQKWNKRRSIVSLQWLKYITCLCGIKLVNVYFLNSTFSLCKYYIFLIENTRRCVTNLLLRKHFLCMVFARFTINWKD